MKRVHQREVINALSIENTAIGEVLDDGALFEKFKGDPQPPVIPQRQTVPNDGVGDGSAYDDQSTPDYYDPINDPYSYYLTSTIGIRILRMFQGGVATPTTNSGFGTKDYAVEMLKPGEEPMTANRIRANGGAKFLFASVYVQNVEISQSGAQKPRLTATFNNGGHHAKIADTNIDINDIEDVLAFLRFDGKLTRLTFSDGVTNYDFAGEKRLIDVGFSGSQNCTPEQMMGDEALDAANECHGGHTENINIDVQTASISAKVYMKDDTFADFDTWKANKKLTSVKLIFKTCEKIGSSTHKCEVEIKFPIGEFNITPDTQNNKDAYAFSIKAIKGDPVTGSLVQMRFRIVGDLDRTA